MNTELTLYVTAIILSILLIFFIYYIGKKITEAIDTTNYILNQINEKNKK